MKDKKRLRLNSRGFRGLRERLFFAFMGVSLVGMILTFCFTILSYSGPLGQSSPGNLAWHSFVLSLAGTLIVSLIVACLEAKHIASPIEAMSDMAQDMAQGRFYEHAFPPSGTEIDALGHSLNFLASSLGRTIEQLKKSNQRLWAVLEASVSGMMIIGGDGEVLRVNKAAEKILGHPRRELEGISYVGALRNTELISLVEKALYSRESSHKEVNLLYPSEKTVDAAAVPLGESRSPATYSSDKNSSSQGAVLVLHDLTAIRRLETVRSDFIQNISHELRTPVTVVKGFAETLKDTPPDDPAAVKEMAELIDSEASRLADLVEKLLSLAKIESGHVVLEKTQIEAGKALEEIVSRMEPLAKRKNQHLTLVKPSMVRSAEPASAASDDQRNSEESPADQDGGAVITADKDMFNMIFTNLIDNAIKYTNDGGQINVGFEPRDGGLLFYVQDNGPGISQEDLPRIFERFYRSAKDRSRLTGGSGLGLAIVKHCVAAHGGKVWAESQERKGATFFVWLPSKPSMQEKPDGHGASGEMN